MCCPGSSHGSAFREDAERDSSIKITRTRYSCRRIAWAVWRARLICHEERIRTPRCSRTNPGSRCTRRTATNELRELCACAGAGTLSGVAMCLAFAITATDALLTALLVAHGVVATLRAEVARNTVRRQHHSRIESRQVTATVVHAMPIATIASVAE
jgi:hypothetical protein